METSTLTSLGATMGFVWLVTQFVKGFIPRAPQNAVALVVGQLFVLPFWYGGTLKLDGANTEHWSGWMIAFVYALIGTASAMKAHDVGSDPKTLIKRMKAGKPIKVGRLPKGGDLMSIRVKRILFWVVITFVVLWLSILIIRAGEIKLVWEPPDSGPEVTGYEVKVDENDWFSVGMDRVYTASIDNCETHIYKVRAVSGELFSLATEIEGYPRPDVTDVMDNEEGTHVIHGVNFDTNFKVFIDAGAGWVQLPSNNVNRVSCTEIRITSIPLNRVKVANVALPLGSGEPTDVFSQPWPGPEVQVE